MTSLIRSFSRAGGHSGDLVLDGQAISQSISAAPGVASALFRNTSNSAVEGQITISHINNFLSASGMTFINFQQSGRLLINVNLDNGPVIIALLSQEITGYLEALMAPLATGEKMTKAEYLNNVALFYNKTTSDEIAGSRVLVSIEFPGAVTSVRGGSFSGRRASFDIPLLDLLVLETPLVYEVTWN
jgi:hypothetical protein